MRRGRWLFHPDQYRQQNPVFQVKKAAVRVTGYVEGVEPRFFVLVGDNPDDPAAKWVPVRINDDQLILTPTVSTEPVTQVIFPTAGWYKLEVEDLLGTQSMVWAEDEEGTLDDVLKPVHIIRPGCGTGVTPPPVIDPILVTCAELQSLVSSGGLQPGRMYGITDTTPVLGPQQVFYTTALAPNRVSLDGYLYVAGLTDQGYPGGAWEARITTLCSLVMLYDPFYEVLAYGTNTIATLPWGTGQVWRTEARNTDFALDASSYIQNCRFKDSFIRLEQASVDTSEFFRAEVRLQEGSYLSGSHVWLTRIDAVASTLAGVFTVGCPVTSYFSSLGDADLRASGQATPFGVGVDLNYSTTSDLTVEDGYIFVEDSTVYRVSVVHDASAEFTGCPVVQDVRVADYAMIVFNAVGVEPFTNLPSQNISVERWSYSYVNGFGLQAYRAYLRNIRLSNNASLILNIPVDEEGVVYAQEMVVENASSVSLDYCDRTREVHVSEASSVQFAYSGPFMYTEWITLEDLHLTVTSWLGGTFPDHIHQVRFDRITLNNSAFVLQVPEAQFSIIQAKGGYISIDADPALAPTIGVWRLDMHTINIQGGQLIVGAFGSLSPWVTPLSIDHINVDESVLVFDAVWGGGLSSATFSAATVHFRQWDPDCHAQWINVTNASATFEPHANLQLGTGSFFVFSLDVNGGAIWAYRRGTGAFGISDAHINGSMQMESFAGTTGDFFFAYSQIERPYNLELRHVAGSGAVTFYGAHLAAFTTGLHTIDIDSTGGGVGLIGFTNWGSNPPPLPTYTTTTYAPYGSNF